MEQRLREAVRLGYTHALAPRGKLPRIPGLTLVQASKVSEAMDKMG
jgi:predicted ATP-dependent serine protease